MIIYNQAFDIYHTIYRMLNLLSNFTNNEIIEIERLRIWDFYLLFPFEIKNIKIKRDEKDKRKIRDEYIKKIKNPYAMVPDNRQIFEKIKPYQNSAINCIAAYGIIDKEILPQNRIQIINKKILSDYFQIFNNRNQDEKRIAKYMTSQYYNISLYGSDGLKSRTQLMESKYDAE